MEDEQIQKYARHLKRTTIHLPRHKAALRGRLLRMHSGRSQEAGRLRTSLASMTVRMRVAFAARKALSAGVVIATVGLLIFGFVVWGSSSGSTQQKLIATTPAKSGQIRSLPDAPVPDGRHCGEYRSCVQQSPPETNEPDQARVSATVAPPPAAPLAAAAPTPPPPKTTPKTATQTVRNAQQPSAQPQPVVAVSLPVEVPVVPDILQGVAGAKNKDKKQKKDKLSKEEKKAQKNGLLDAALTEEVL